MGLIKAAIILGAGGYAINKFSKSREEGHGCGCRRRNQNRDGNQPQESYDNHVQQGTWTPGTKLRGPSPEREKLPEYVAEKDLTNFRDVKN